MLENAFLKPTFSSFFKIVAWFYQALLWRFKGHALTICKWIWFVSLFLYYNGSQLLSQRFLSFWYIWWLDKNVFLEYQHIKEARLPREGCCTDLLNWLDEGIEMNKTFRVIDWDEKNFEILRVWIYISELLVIFFILLFY